MNKFKKFAPFTFIIFIIILGIKISQRVDDKVDKINQNGTLIHAVVNKSFYARGFNLEVSYQFKKSNFIGYTMTESDIYKSGDSVLIKINPDLPGDEIVLLKKIKY